MTTMTAFDHAERRIWSGKAEAYARTYARLCAHPAAALPVRGWAPAQ
ncbi:hypothetical protein ACWGBY_31595 [Streptomyces griseus]|nr:hypothetical protein [Streptomyces sp. ID01-9D]MDX5577431.1 hypothetical protein [Streptomyces sp. ID01-9D]WTC92400.1 hypothetical protein OH733_23495 [Streptomyces griseus]WTD72559.1 hypothetical protein OH763_13490 [Streptomyces griseus]